MELGHEGITPQIEKEVVNDLRSLNLKKDIKVEEVNEILKKAKTSIDHYCICPNCASDERTENKKVHYIGEGTAPISPNEIPPNLIESVATNSAFCPDHKVRFDLLGTVSHENGVEPVNIAWYVLPEGTKIDLKEANASNKHWKIYDYQYVNTVNGKTITKNLQVVFFLDKKQYETQDSKDKVVRNPIGGTLPAKDIPTPTAAELMTPVQELLVKGPVVITRMNVEVTYGGKVYKFKKTVFLNNSLRLHKQNGYRINPENPTEIIFTDLQYIAQAKMDEKQLKKVASDQDEVIRTLITMDLNIALASQSELKKLTEEMGGSQENSSRKS